MKTAIVVITFNIYDQVFLLQMEALKKFCQDDDYSIEIIDNSSDPQAAESIKYHATRLEIPYTRTRAQTGDSSWSHCFAAQVSLHILNKREPPFDFYIYLDHDCIPVKPFSVKQILDGKAMAGLAQNKSTTYFWPGCFMWDAQKVNADDINFSPSSELGLDTGGLLHRAIDKYGREECVFFDEQFWENPGFSGSAYTIYSMLCNETFMHFVNASNWNKIEGNTERLNSLINIAREKAGLIQ